MVIVKNHFPGRVRFTIPDVAKYPGIGGDWINQSLIAIQGIQEIRVNEHARSVIVNYDESLLDSKTLHARIEALNLAEGRQSDGISHQYTRGDVA